MTLSAPILTTALGVVVRLASRVAGFSSKAFSVAKEAVAQVEAENPGAGKGEAKFQMAIAAVITGIPPVWAMVLVQLAWLLFEHTSYPKVQ